MKGIQFIWLFSGLLLITSCSALFGPEEEEKTQPGRTPEEPSAPADEAEEGGFEITPEGVLQHGADPTESATQKPDSGEEKPSDESTESGNGPSESGDRNSPQDPLTPFDQSSAPGDIELTRAIRSAITSDGSLSFSARNIAIITVDGTVTLRGQVGSEEERARVLSITKQVMKKGRIYDKLAVP